ncbi:MAG: RHS repeat domain-containing protein [Verrucomicrobiia bacterium]
MKNLLCSILLMVFVISGWAQKYDYDKAGRLVKVTYDSGKKIYYYYDKAGNLVSVRETKKSRRELRSQSKKDLSKK